MIFNNKIVKHKYLLFVILCASLVLYISFDLIFDREYLNSTRVYKKEHQREGGSNKRLSFLDFETFLVKKTGPENLPDLTSIDWPKYPGRIGPIITSDTKNNFEPFQAQVSPEEKSRIVHLLKIVFTKLYENHLGLCMFVAGGTKLGSFRHHDFIPWDDDIDLSIEEFCVEKFTMILNELHPQIKYYTKFGNIKVFWASDVPTSKYKWSWPYLDILIFSKNATHINEILESYGRNYSYLHKDIYPLIYRPFGKLWLPSPANILSTLVIDYGHTEYCSGTYYSHILEDGLITDRRKCDDLGEKYAFVERKLVGPIEKSDPRFVWIEETLFLRKGKNRMNKQKIHSLILVGHITSVTTSAYDLIIKL